MEKIKTNEVLDNVSKLFQAQLEEINKLREQNETLVWKSNAIAAKETGLGSTYFDRIRHKLPHIDVSDEESGTTSVVYPKAAVKKWLDEHTEFY